MNELKVFTVPEANQILPRLIPILQDLKAKRDAILKLEVEIDLLELVQEKREKGAASAAVSQKVDEYTLRVNQFYKLSDALHETGCVLKDVDKGLVDFYSLYKGKIVYLCWKLGESEISHWHEIGSGFASRQPLEQVSEH